ncbi:MAG TPA: hypothetical protein VFI31_24240 [Pirellulales bacterium]|nr:hypothetical protein [Pirellulales bacterium]
MKFATLSAVAIGLILTSAATALKAEEGTDPTGTWKWSVTRNNQTREMTLKLKLEGDKLSGAMLGRDNQERPIEDAKYKDGEVSFTVTREFNGQKMVFKYNGKVSGDTIKGKVEFQRDGQTNSFDWEPKREKA